MSDVSPPLAQSRGLAVTYYSRWAYDARYAIAGVLVPVVVGSVAAATTDAVHRCKYTAAALYVAGSLLAGLGAAQNVTLLAGRNWGVLSWRERIAAWFAGIRRPVPRIVNISGEAHGTSSTTARGRGIVGTPTVEQRLAWLEEDRDRLQAELLATQDTLGKTSARVASLQVETSDELAKLRAVLKASMVDGAQQQLLGVWLLAVGRLVSLFPW